MEKATAVWSPMPALQAWATSFCFDPETFESRGGGARIWVCATGWLEGDAGRGGRCLWVTNVAVRGRGLERGGGSNEHACAAKGHATFVRAAVERQEPCGNKGCMLLLGSGGGAATADV